MLGWNKPPTPDRVRQTKLGRTAICKQHSVLNSANRNLPGAAGRGRLTKDCLLPIHRRDDEPVHEMLWIANSYHPSHLPCHAGSRRMIVPGRRIKEKNPELPTLAAATRSDTDKLGEALQTTFAKKSLNHQDAASPMPIRAEEMQVPPNPTQASRRLITTRWPSASEGTPRIPPF